MRLLQAADASLRRTLLTAHHALDAPLGHPLADESMPFAVGRALLRRALSAFVPGRAASVHLALRGALREAMTA